MNAANTRRQWLLKLPVTALLLCLAILTRFGVRDYDAATGRWTTRDPLFFATDGTNLYAYASGDPINRRDADGMDDAPAGGGVCILKPQPLPGYDQGPIYLDPKPQKPEPPVKPVPSFLVQQLRPDHRRADLPGLQPAAEARETRRP